MVNEPRWSQSSLHRLPVVERQFTVSRQVGIRATQANLNLALCLLQATNRLVPATPVGNVRSWKMIIGAEMNCLAAVRGYVATAFLNEVPDSVRSVLRECAKQAALPAAELIGAEPRALKEVVRRTITALWLWKTGEPPALATSADWRDLIDKLSGTQVWTRDVIYAQREKFIKELAKYLASEEALSQSPGLGPQVFEEADLPTTRPPIADEPVVAAPTAEETKPATPIEEPLSETQTPAINTIDLYLDRVLPTAPQYVPMEWHSVIKVIISKPRVFVQGEVGSGKTNLMYAIAAELKRGGLIPLCVDVSEYAPSAVEMDILQFEATLGAFGQAYRDEGVRREFEVKLAEAEQTGRLVVLADQSDDLFATELTDVGHRLSRFKRLVLAERSPRLTFNRSDAAVAHMPHLSAQSAIDLLSAISRATEHSEGVITDLQVNDVQINPALSILASRQVSDQLDLHPVTLLGSWVDNLLKQTRSAKIVAEEDKARRVLRYLAAIGVGIAPHPKPTSDLIRENVRRAFWDLPLQPEEEDQGWALIDLGVTKSG